MSGCITCGGGRGRDGAPISNTALLEEANRLYHTGDFVLAVYQGPRYPHPVSSPTGALYREYGYSKYSQQSQGGKSLLIMAEDVKARPDLFTVIPEDEEKHAVVCEQFGIDVDFVEPEKVVQVPVLDDDLTVVTPEVDTQETLPDVQDEEASVFPTLTQETAITLKEFTTQHPDYSHHLQVLAQVKQGNLQSEKRDKVIYVWHTQEDKD